MLDEVLPQQCTTPLLLPQVLREVADQMQSLGLSEYRSTLVWMIHCSQKRVTEAQLRDFAAYGGAIAPEKVSGRCSNPGALFGNPAGHLHRELRQCSFLDQLLEFEHHSWPRRHKGAAAESCCGRRNAKAIIKPAVLHSAACILGRSCCRPLACAAEVRQADQLQHAILVMQF